MRLLYITNQVCGAAGLERVLSIKTDYLIEHFGYEIHILTLNQKDEKLFYKFNKKISYHDIEAIGNPIKYFTDYVKGLKRVVKIVKPDIISVCDDGLKGFFVPKIIGKPCPMIYERHVSKNVEITEDSVSLKTKLISYLTYKLMHYGARSYNKFVVLTNDNLKEWELDNLHVISNPLSFAPKEMAALENKVVLAVGRQSYQKGYDRLLKSWQKLSKKYPEWKLHIYGKIDESLELDKLSNKLNIFDSVHFYPPTKDIKNVYLNSSIYVMSSRFEGFGMVLTEAMICGVPVISFDCPCGPKDIISHNEDGFLVKNNDIDALSESIEVLINNKELRKKMGIKAKSNVNRFKASQIVPQWNQLFKSLINESSI